MSAPSIPAAVVSPPAFAPARQDAPTLAAWQLGPWAQQPGADLAAIRGVSTGVSLRRTVGFACSPIAREDSDDTGVGKLALTFKLRRDRPDIVHLNSSLNPKGVWRDAVYAAIAQLARRTVMLKMNGGPSPQGIVPAGPLRAAAMGWLQAKLDALVTMGTGMRSAFAAFAPIARVSTTPNGINPESFSGNAKQFAESELTLGYFGRLVTGKGLFETLEAMHLLSRRGLDQVRLLVVGCGPAEPALRERAHQLDLSDRIDFAGDAFGVEKAMLWDAVHISMLTARHAAVLADALVESMASGTPVIVAPLGALPEGVADTVHGRFVRTCGAEDIADAIESMWCDKTALRAMSAACIQHARHGRDTGRLAGYARPLCRALVH